MVVSGAELCSEPTVRWGRQLVHGNLVALGKIGIEIILPRKARTLLHGAVKRQRRAYGHLQGPAIEDRQRARQAEAYLADAGIGRVADARRAAAEDFGLRAKSPAHFEADDRLAASEGVRRDT